jgi:hypothetical protein
MAIVVQPFDHRLVSKPGAVAAEVVRGQPPDRGVEPGRACAARFVEAQFALLG